MKEYIIRAVETNKIMVAKLNGKHITSKKVIIILFNYLRDKKGIKESDMQIEIV